ncbi:hypothetical protein DFH09DRAFT_1210829 [Mycena vulgaris]|nr:hypothetical protein DFH09DRAFT_1210829 [Mycena vulgaris]
MSYLPITLSISQQSTLQRISKSFGGSGEHSGDTITRWLSDTENWLISIWSGDAMSSSAVSWWPSTAGDAIARWLSNASTVLSKLSEDLAQNPNHGDQLPRVTGWLAEADPEALRYFRNHRQTTLFVSALIFFVPSLPLRIIRAIFKRALTFLGLRSSHPPAPRYQYRASFVSPPRRSIRSRFATGVVSLLAGLLFLFTSSLEE